MLRSSIYGAGVLALSAAAFAQKQELRGFERINGPIKDGGTYHVATGQWTRGGVAQLAAAPGSDIVYNCTTESGYYFALSPSRVITVPGRLPSLNSPSTLWNPALLPVGSAPGSSVGCANSYQIDGFQIGFCSNAVGPTTSMTVAFYQSWTPVCTTPVVPAPQGGPFALTGLPGGGTGGFACWNVTIDLAGATASFSMLADGDGTYVDNTSDAFAWTMTFPSITAPPVAGIGTGPIMAGAPADATGPNHTGVGWLQFPPSINDEAAGYDGTRFDTVVGANLPMYPANGAVGLPTPAGEAGSDMVGDDGFRMEGGTAVPGCYFFGGPLGSGGNFDGPYANYFLELYAKTVCTPPPPGTESCAGDGLDPLVGTSCPCSNFGGLGRGCASSFNATGARIAGSGDVATDTVVLTASGVNATGNAIFMRGNVDNVTGTVFGDGVRCVDGTLIRRTKPISSPNQATFPSPTDTVTLSNGWGAANITPPGSAITVHYMAYYRNAAAAFCPPETFNGTNMYTITW